MMNMSARTIPIIRITRGWSINDVDDDERGIGVSWLYVRFFYCWTWTMDKVLLLHIYVKSIQSSDPFAFICLLPPHNRGTTTNYRSLTSFGLSHSTAIGSLISVKITKAEKMTNEVIENGDQYVSLHFTSLHSITWSIPWMTGEWRFAW